MGQDQCIKMYKSKKKKCMVETENEIHNSLLKTSFQLLE